jgi:glycosyltransferase involved in cell wall biosynthesis
MICQKFRKACYRTINRLFDRIVDQTDKSLLVNFLRHFMVLHGFTHALYHYRIGNISRARDLTAGQHQKSKFQKDIFASISEISSIVEHGYDTKIIMPRAFPPWNRKVLFALHYSLPYLTSGYAIRSHAILTHLRQSGIDVMAATKLNYPWDLAKQTENDFPRKDIIDGIQYTRLRDKYDSKGFRGLKYIDAYAQKLAKTALGHNASILHSASNFLNGLAGARAARLTGCKSIFEVRGLWHLTQAAKNPNFNGTDYYLYCEIMELAAAKEADALVTISEALKEYLIKRGIEQKKITVIPNAVDTKLFKPQPSDSHLKKQLGLDGKTIIGYIGSITAYEGLDLLVKATSRLIEQGANLCLLIIGNGYYESTLKKLALSLPNKNYIKFLGHIPFDEIQKYYSMIDIFPFPRKGYEVCRLVPPLKILEAMAMAKPVIVSALPPFLEMVKDGKTGLICNTDDLQSLLESIQRLYENPDEQQFLGKAARKWVAENRSWEDMSKKYIDLYMGK